MPSSNPSLPLPVIVQLVIVSPFTAFPLMPCWPEFRTLTLLRTAVVTLCKKTFATHDKLLPVARSPPQVVELPATVCEVRRW